MSNSINLLEDLNAEQRQACICLDNYLLTACPGSGKTRTIIYRLAYLSYFFTDSRLLNIAITFTNRAADEIKERVIKLGVQDNSIWTGTIHQFCIEFILRPYSMFSDRLKKGFTIIDEHIKREYIVKICAKKGIKVKYESDDELLQNPIIREEYDLILIKNREIDFNDILIISNSLLSNNELIATNISKIIRSIQVDEYQDTSILQYSVIKEIFRCNSSIILSFVGDVNQSIYTKLGGIALSIDDIKSQFNSDFQDLKLVNCYRSTQKIIDYYSNYQMITESINSMRTGNDLTSTITLNTITDYTDLKYEVAKVIKIHFDEGYDESDICILVPDRWKLYDLGNELRDLLPDVQFDSPELTPIKYDPLNPFYLIAKLLFTSPGRRTRYRKRLASEVIKIFSSNSQIVIPEMFDVLDLLKTINSTPYDEDGIVFFQTCISNVFEVLNIGENEISIIKSKNDYLKKIQDRIENIGLPHTSKHFRMCFREKSGVVLSTYHGVKGEEYRTVIATGLLKGLIPHWNDVINEPDGGDKIAKLLVYVGCSRAKNNLFLFAERGRLVKRSGNELEVTRVLINPK